MDPFLASLCEALICVGADIADLPAHQASLVRTALFLQAQVLALPLLLRVGLRASLLLFRLYVFLTSLRPFHRLALAERVRATERWARGPVAPARQAFRALRNLALLAYFEGASSTAVSARVSSILHR